MEQEERRRTTHPRTDTHLVLLLRLEDGLQEGPALVAGRLLVEHARLDHLLVHVELVLGRRQDLLLHAVDRAEAQHAHLVLLADAVGAVLGLQVLVTRGEKSFGCLSGHHHANVIQDSRFKMLYLSRGKLLRQ